MDRATELLFAPRFEIGGSGMEMHQIRYFLAVSRTLNFTRAAEECSVAQPSLTRAIQSLEAELGGELFLRERARSHLTELGQRMLPLIQQCYDSAVNAKSLASAIKTGRVAPLKLALSLSINIAIVLPSLNELARSFPGLEIRFLRGGSAEMKDALEKGAADLAVAGPLRADWERLDQWTLFTERFMLAVSEDHRFANRDRISLAEIREEKIVRRAHCESVGELDTLLRELGLIDAQRHEVCSEADVAAMLTAGVGVAIVPASSPLPSNVRRVRLEGFDHKRCVGAYAVAGRPRCAPAGTILNMLRASDWSHYSFD
jgi:DNA-binding transcriptional LysR family regulator